MTKGFDITEALEFAKAEVIYARDTPIDVGIGEPVRFLSNTDGRRLAKTMMKQLAESDQRSLALYADSASQGWGLADGALRELIADTLQAGRQVPALLDAYRSLKPHPKKPGTEKADNCLRDIAIAVIVMKVSEKFNLSPTAKGANPSACLVVSKALFVANIGKGYKAIEAIWNRVGPMLIGPS